MINKLNHGAATGPLVIGVSFQLQNTVRKFVSANVMQAGGNSNV